MALGLLSSLSVTWPLAFLNHRPSSRSSNDKETEYDKSVMEMMCWSQDGGEKV